MKISREMLKAARALLRWNQHDLAKAAGVSVETIRRIEGSDSVPTLVETRDAIEGALTGNGIEFSTDRGEGVLRLHKGSRPKA
jgi:transcriptional regulator with XRE-family HTH domain